LWAIAAVAVYACLFAMVLAAETQSVSAPGNRLSSGASVLAAIVNFPAITFMGQRTLGAGNLAIPQNGTFGQVMVLVMANGLVWGIVGLIISLLNRSARISNIQ
jgi:hypothetical protein